LVTGDLYFNLLLRSELMTDQELITGIRNRDRQVIRHLVGTYHKQVIKTAYNFTDNMDDAEDIAQDVCIEILESVKHFRGDSSLSTWIYRLTVNKSLNFIRKNKRKQLVRQFETFFRIAANGAWNGIPEPYSTEDPVQKNESRILLDDAVSRLPENQKTAFILNKYEEMSYKQVAEVMNLSLSSVESLLQRAKQNLQKSLIAQFSEYSKTGTS